VLLEAINNGKSARKPGILLPSRPDILHWNVLNSNLVRDLQYRWLIQAKGKLVWYSPTSPQLRIAPGDIGVSGYLFACDVIG
jgi:hypothetical protein